MKKLLLFTALVACTFTTVQSQEVRFGAKIGINIASLGGDSTGNLSLGAVTAFHLGGLAEISLSEKFALQPELLYSFEGFDNSAIGNSYTMKLDYIRVPVLAKYYIIDNLSAEAGPTFGVLVSAKADDVDVKDSFKSFDTALSLGASYSLDMGVFFSLRYNLGLLDISDDGSSLKNQMNVFQVSAGYMF